MASRPDVEQRHRVQRAATRGRLLECTRALVEEVPWNQVSIEAITERAGLARSGFYKHFADKRALLWALIDELGSELTEVPSVWQRDAEGDPRELLREAVRQLVATFQRHGRLVRALSDEAAIDREFGARYAALGEALSAAVAVRIALDVANGHSSVTDPDEVATALVWMNERFLLVRFGQAPLGDPERAAAALSEVWIRTIYEASNA